MKQAATLLAFSLAVTGFAQGKSPNVRILEMAGFYCPLTDISGGQVSSDLVPIENPLQGSIVQAYRAGKAKYKNIVLRVSPPSSQPLLLWLSERCKGASTGMDFSIWTAPRSGQGLLDESVSGDVASFTYPACTFGRGPRQTVSLDGSFDISCSAKVITDRDTGRSKGFGRLGGNPNAAWITNTCVIRLAGFNTDGVVASDPLTVTFGTAADGKSPTMDVSPLNLTIDPLQAELFFDGYEEQIKSGRTLIIPSGVLLDSPDSPVLGMGFRNLWIQECYIGWDLMAHVSLRCDDFRLLVGATK